MASGVMGGRLVGLAALAQSAGWDLGRRLAALARGDQPAPRASSTCCPPRRWTAGRALHGFLWWITENRWLATRLAAGAGTAARAAPAASSACSPSRRADPLDGVVLLLMGWFVISSSKREQLAGRAQHVLGDVHVSDIMRPAVIAPGLADREAFWNEWVKPLP